MDKYNKSNPKSIETYAKKLIGKTFGQVVKDYEIELLQIKEDNQIYVTDIQNDNINNKGNLGQIIEEKYFNYKCNSESEPDFKEAGVELKVTPYKINKKGQLVAKERLIITMIDYYKVINEEFENSHCWRKSKLVLLIYYLYSKEVKSRLEYKINYVNLFTPSEQDIKIIKNDYNVIVSKIREGKAHELSEGDTLYLGAATKAANASVTRKQPYSDIEAKPRAFAFKNSYMTYILNKYIIPNKVECESIVKNRVVESFETYVEEMINTYAGYTVEKLCDIFKINKENPPKNLGAIIAYRILGIKGNQAEEFIKANIVVKTIRVENSNKIKENMSFPTFKFKDIVEEIWEDSRFRIYLQETRFMFIVYKYNDNGELILQGCQFWNIPYADLNTEVADVWNKTKQIINNGVIITEKNGKYYNNLPKATENAVCHVRPHGRNSKDTYELPDGREMTKQCFWLNNTYILAQLDKKLIR